MFGPEIFHTGEPIAHWRSSSLWLEVEEERENRAHTHSTSTSIGRSSADKMAKLNSLTSLSCSGKLYIQLYLSNPSTQTCTGCHAATVTRFDSRTDFGAYPCYGYSAIGEPFDACPCHGYNTVAAKPFRRLPLPRVPRESSRLVYNSSPNPAANPRTSTLPIIFFSSVNRRRPSGLVRTAASCRSVSTNSALHRHSL